MGAKRESAPGLGPAADRVVIYVRVLQLAVFVSPYPPTAAVQATDS